MTKTTDREAIELSKKMYLTIAEFDDNDFQEAFDAALAMAIRSSPPFSSYIDNEKYAIDLLLILCREIALFKLYIEDSVKLPSCCLAGPRCPICYHFKPKTLNCPVTKMMYPEHDFSHDNDCGGVCNDDEDYGNLKFATIIMSWPDIRIFAREVALKHDRLIEIIGDEDGKKEM